MVPFLLVIKFQQEVSMMSSVFITMTGFLLFLQLSLNFSHFRALFKILEGPNDIGLDLYICQGGLVVCFSYNPPKQPYLVCFLMSLLMLVDP